MRYKNHRRRLHCHHACIEPPLRSWWVLDMASIYPAAYFQLCSWEDVIHASKLCWSDWACDIYERQRIPITDQISSFKPRIIHLSISSMSANQIGIIQTTWYLPPNIRRLCRQRLTAINGWERFPPTIHFSWAACVPFIYNWVRIMYSMDQRRYFHTCQSCSKSNFRGEKMTLTLYKI